MTMVLMIAVALRGDRGLEHGNMDAVRDAIDIAIALRGDRGLEPKSVSFTRTHRIAIDPQVFRDY